MAVTNYALEGVSENTKNKLLQAQQPYQVSANALQMKQNAAKFFRRFSGLEVNRTD